MPKRAGAGRPTKLTDETQKTILRAIRLGAYRETAAAAAGIRSKTLREWMRRGARGDGPRYVAFVAAMERAGAEAEVTDLALLTKAAASDWKAAAWKLARLHPERYSEHRHVELSGKVEADIDLSALTVDELRTLKRLRKKITEGKKDDDDA